MNKQRLLHVFILVLFAGLVLVNGQSHASVANDLITEYQQSGAQQPNPENARELWTQKFRDKKGENTRSCASCHTDNLRSTGKHVRTNKPIEQLSPSLNSERLTEAKKIEKWFKRNCKWTFGRECSPQEKSDFLSYILSH